MKIFKISIIALTAFIININSASARLDGSLGGTAFYVECTFIFNPDVDRPIWRERVYSQGEMAYYVNKCRNEGGVPLIFNN